MTDKPKLTLDDRIRRAEELKARADKRLSALKAKADKRARKEDTRRKIIVGALILNKANKDPEFSNELYTMLKNSVEERDHYLFVGLWPDAKKPEHQVKATGGDLPFPHKDSTGPVAQR